MHDTETQTFVYLTYSTRLVDGSPKNAITAVHYGD
ncbi:MAG: CreA family protein [Halomonas sp.]